MLRHIRFHQLKVYVILLSAKICAVKLVHKEFENFFETIALQKIFTHTNKTLITHLK